MVIDDFDTDRRVLIVAEIGNNHEGSYALAEELIGLAAQAGADAVKFQTFRTQHYISPCDPQRFEQLKSFELRFEQFERLSRSARDEGVLFLSTPFDIHSAQLLNDIVAAYKISSGDLTFYPLLEVVGETGKPVIVSTGLSTLDEIAAAKQTVQSIWRNRGLEQSIALLHCVSSYPTPAHEVNLAAIRTLKHAFQCTVGYSDHTLGIEASVLAAAVGARIVEKHFTVAKDYSDFRDHQLSADPQEMATLVRRIREVERMVGNGAKIPRTCERDGIRQLRRSVVARRDLLVGTVLGEQDITWMRPGGGVAPGQERILLGRTVAVHVTAGAMITPDLLTANGPIPAQRTDQSPATV